MYNKKELKRHAKTIFHNHYFLFLLLCLVAAMIGTNYSNSYVSFTDEIKNLTTNGDTEAENINSRWKIDEAIYNVLDSRKESKEVTQDLITEEEQTQSGYLTKHIELGHYNGVLAKVRNQVVSGAFIISTLTALTSVIGSSSIAVAFFEICAFAVAFFFWVFFINVYKVIYARMFLEGRIYNKVPLQRLAFLFYVKKWGHTAITMLLQSFYYNLWCLTIIGGFIKYYSYFAVPYIVAENPSIGSKEAICLSRKMMKGHKWECFKYNFSFIGWIILDICTFGISGLLYSNPYMEAAMCEYYVYIRKEAIKNNIQGTEALNDIYLFEIPSKDTLAKHYGSIDTYCISDTKQSHNVIRKLSDFFGIYLFESNYESEKELIKQKNRYLRVKYILNQEEYGQKLLPIPEKKRRSILEFMYFNRKYSIKTLILFFMFFSCLGWVWEVSLHMIQFGDFVNRGTLYGPYLPIYGSGGIIILLCLYKFRNNPVLEFISSIILCGIIEYYTGYALETMHNGQKWWNYTGYFLNIDGRVCAEGLLVFGLGGMIIVYFIAPIFDNIVKKIPKKISLCLILIVLIMFNSDVIYSSIHPNTGEGITSSTYDYMQTTQSIIPYNEDLVLNQFEI